MLGTDRFGNRIDGEVHYARGQILRGTEDDFDKIEKAHAIIAQRIREGKQVFNFSGLERVFPAERQNYEGFDDDTAAAFFEAELRETGLQHLGGTPKIHDIFLANRLTAATFATHLALVKAGDTVVGVSPSYTHATVVRSVNRVGARFVDTSGWSNFSRVLEAERNVSLVVLTRLAVTYDILPADELARIVRLAKARGIRIYLDDAGGARVGPAIFGQPKSLELGVDVAATGLDKYGTFGPRFGLLGGKKELVARIRSRAWELGLEARPIFYGAALESIRRYKAERVAELVKATREVARELVKHLGNLVRETPVTAQITGEDLLQLLLEKLRPSKNDQAPRIVPYEVTAALAMLLLQDYGIVTVHFAGVPPGTSSLLVKFVAPETLNKFGGAKRFGEAVSESIAKLSEIVRSPNALEQLLFH